MAPPGSIFTTPFARPFLAPTGSRGLPSIFSPLVPIVGAPSVILNPASMFGAQEIQLSGAAGHQILTASQMMMYSQGAGSGRGIADYSWRVRQVQSFVAGFGAHIARAREATRGADIAAAFDDAGALLSSFNLLAREGGEIERAIAAEHYAVLIRAMVDKGYTMAVGSVLVELLTMYPMSGAALRMISADSPVARVIGGGIHVFGLERPPTAAETRHREMMDALGLKVRFVSSLLARVMAISPQADAAAELEAIWNEEVGRIFGADTLSRYEEYEALVDAADEVGEESGDWRDPEVPVPESSDIEFLYVLNSHRVHLQWRHTQIDTFLPTLSPALAKHLNEQIPARMRRADIDPKGIVSVTRQAFSAIIVLTPSAYDRVFGRDSLGMYIPGTPFIFVREDSDNQMTREHETIHSLTEGVVLIKDPVAVFLRRLRLYNDDLIHSVDDETRSENLKLLADANDYLDMLHGEILAAVEQGAQQEFGHGEGARGMSRGGMFGFDMFDDDVDVGRRAGAMRTAGIHTQQLLIAIDKAWSLLFVGVGGDDMPAARRSELSTALMNLRGEFKNGFSQAIRFIDDARYVARSLGGDAEGDVESLLYVLMPSQYRDIRYYFEYNYGRQRVQSLYHVARLRNFATMEDLDQGVDELERSPHLATGELVQAVNRWMKASGMTFEEFGADSVEGMRANVSVMERLGQIDRIDSEAVDGFIDTIRHFSFMLYLERDIPNQLANLGAIWAILTEDERDKFVEALENNFMYILESRGMLSDGAGAAEIKSLPLWRQIESVGLASLLEAHLDQCIADDPE